MAKAGPILIIDDDKDDCELIMIALQQLNISNAVRCFENGKHALDYLQATPDKPFLIFCDINMPVMDGLELRRQISLDPQLRNKSIPFIFLSTTANPVPIKEAYEMSVQGFFVKGKTVEEIRQLVKEIVSYWSRCKHPNN